MRSSTQTLCPLSRAPAWENLDWWTRPWNSYSQFLFVWDLSWMVDYYLLPSPVHWFVIAGYQKADILPQEFWQIHSNETFDVFSDCCLLFFEKLFNAATAKIQQVSQANKTLPCQWYKHFHEHRNREQLYASVVTKMEVSCWLVLKIYMFSFIFLSIAFSQLRLSLPLPFQMC